MKSVILTSAAIITLSASSSIAQGNSGLARSMSDALKGGAATLGGQVNPEKGNNGKGTASDVSGGGNGGWGNVGSAAVSGGQVSNRGGTRGQTLGD